MQYVEVRRAMDGTIIISVSALPDDLPKTLNIGGLDFELLSRSNKSGLVQTATFVSQALSVDHVRVAQSYTYKNIPDSVLEYYARTITPRAHVVDLNQPTSVLRIRCVSDPWINDESEGWCVVDVLNDLGVGSVSIPSAFNYIINEVQIKAGTPIASVIHSLLPIPGLLVTVDENRNIRVSVGQNPNVEPPGAICWEEADSLSQEDFDNIVVGGNSFPEAVQGGMQIKGIEQAYSPIFGGVMDLFGRATVYVYTNLAGGMFGVQHEQSTVRIRSEFIEKMFSSGSSIS